MPMHRPDSAPRRDSRPRRAARRLLELAGWRTVLVWPPAPKGIIVVYPHTSNWDFVIGILYKFGVGLPVRWVGKDTLFRWPLRRLFQRLGGIPVDRHAPGGIVRELLAEFDRQDWMWLALAPEGTRSRTDHWKSGFYRIAVGGGLPVGLGFIDYATRTIGIDTYLALSGDPQQDLARIRAFYDGKRGRRPGHTGAICLPE